MVATTHKFEDGNFLLSQREAAVLAGVTAVTLYNWDQEENPPPRTPTGAYPAREFGEWMRKRQITKRGRGFGENYPFAPEGWRPGHATAKPIRLPGLPGLPEPQADTTKTDTEIRVNTARAEKLEMENMVAAGQLVPVADVETGLSQMIVRVKNRLLRLPVALAALVLGDDDVYSIQSKLKDGIYDALSEVSVDWKSAGAENDPTETD
jgi:predicted DNA-binding transcriptional regulator AlpA